MFIKKNRILLTILVAILLSVVAITVVAAMALETTIYEDTTSVSLFSSGKSSITIEIDRSQLAKEQQDDTAFAAYFQEYLDAINQKSGDTDFVVLENCETTEQGFRVTVATRRVDKLLGIGEFIYSGVEDILPADEESLANYAKGTVKMRIRRVYPGGDDAEILYYIGYSAFSKSQNLTISPVSAASGDKVSYADFASDMKGDSRKLLVFKMPDLSFISKMTVTFSGNIRYVSSEGVRVIDDRTIEITPISVNANIGKAEGEEITIPMMLGYVVYDAGMSPLVLAAIVIGIIWLLALPLCYFFWQQNKVAKRKLFGEIKRYKMLYLMLIPGLALLIIFHYVPYFGLSAAFQDYDLVEGVGSEWVGMKYFSRIFFANTERIYRVFRNTIFISLLRVVTNFPLILMYALFVYSLRNRKLKSVVQTVSFIPYFLSWTACSGFLYAIISDYGILNSILVKFGLEAVSWYGETDAWWGILSISSLWKGMGWGTLIYIAAMCNIDNELYEASALDGCGAIRQMFTVTIPGIMPVVCLQLILDSASLMKDNYEQILALINGSTGLKDTTEVIGQISYDALRNSSGYGSAVAFGLIQGVIGLILVFVSNKIVKKTDNEGIF